jgi:peptidoglycan hydrolase-like protein with peptidoglycan-binding domain
VSALPLPTLQQGDAGPSVSALQLGLAALGFDVGPVDGEFSDTTAAAVAQFQEAQGVAATGVVDDATWELIGGQSFDSSEATQFNPDEFPSISRAVTFSQDIDAYLQDLGIDSTTISDDDPVA